MAKFIYNWRHKGSEDPDVYGWANPDTPDGWYCTAYADLAPDGFDDWMFANMKGSFSCVLRFNSGTPAYIIFIEDEEDAMLFKLTWIDQMEWSF